MELIKKFIINKRSIISFLAVVVSAFVGFKVGSSNWETTEKSTELKQNVALTDQTASATKVCYINSNTDSTSYYTIEQALLKANSGDTVYVIPDLGKNVYVLKNCTVKSGVTLSLPYSGTATDEIVAESTSAFADNTPSTYRHSELIINENVKMTVNGSLNVGGKWGGTSPQGGTQKDYCEITMNNSSTIEVSGTLTCTGFIKETSTTGGASIIVQNGGDFETPMAMYDWGSGSSAYGKYNDGVFPVKRFDLPNIRPTVVVNYGGKFVGKYRAWGSSAGQVANGSTAIISNSSPAFLIMSTGCVVSYHFSDKSSLTATSLNDETNHKALINVNGNATLGSLIVNATVNGVSLSLDTSDYYFPIPAMYKITILSGTFSVPKKIKFLPGSSLEIKSGASASATANIIFYQSNKATDGTKVIPSYSTTTPATLINDGQINIQANFSGLIKHTANITTGVIITSSTMVNVTDSYESNSSKSFLSSTEDKRGPFSWNSTADIAKNNTGTNLQRGFQVIPSMTYRANSDYWYYDPDSISTYTMTPSFESGLTTYSFALSIDGGTSTTYSNLSVLPTLNETTGTTLTFSSLIGCSIAIGSNTIGVGSTGSYNVFSNATIEIKAVVPMTGITANCDETSQTGVATSSSCSFSVYSTLNPTGATNVNSSSYTWHVRSGSASFTSANESLTTVNITASGSNSTTVTAVVYLTVSDANGTLFTSNDLTLSCTTSCLVAGTMISMADGTEKPVEMVALGDAVKIWNFQTGNFDIRPVIFIECLRNYSYKRTDIHFDDGTSVSLATSQSYFDVDALDFFTVSSMNGESCIGRRVMGMANDTLSIKTIIEVDTYDAVGDVYEVLTAYDLNFFCDGVLSRTPVAGPSIFKIVDGYKYDPEAMEADIDKYGLFEFSDFAAYMTEDEFIYMGIKYYKIGVGKGYYTIEDLIKLAEYFAGLKAAGNHK
jgi:hypothetical protein